MEPSYSTTKNSHIYLVPNYSVDLRKHAMLYILKTTVVFFVCVQKFSSIYIQIKSIYVFILPLFYGPYVGSAGPEPECSGKTTYYTLTVSNQVSSMLSGIVSIFLP